MLIAQITDLHVRPEGKLIYGTVDTAACLTRAVATLNALAPRPDLVLLTGDLVDAGSAEEYARLRGLLVALTLPYRLVPGNHDARHAMVAAFPDHPYLHSEDGFLHWTMEDKPLRLVALDSLEPGQVAGRLCAARLEWLDRRLAAARDRPTLVVVHHPPFLTGVAHMDGKPFEGAAAFAEIVRVNPQVERVIAGHVHRSISVRWAGTLASTCPSTAHQFALDLVPAAPATYTLEPPGFQLHHWQRATGLVTHTGSVGDYKPRRLR